VTGVTYSGKCYISVCVGCDLLFEAVRSDQITCSGACRVRAHRGTRLVDLRRLADTMHTDVADMMRTAALSRLCPELEPEIMSGAITLDDALPDLKRAYNRRSMEAARLKQGDASCHQ
jgi:hypothetical protein